MAAAKTCPHGCTRCRMVEAGLAGMPLTPEQFANFHDLIVPAPIANGWQPETTEAAYAVDVAEAAYADAERVWLDAERAMLRAPEDVRRARVVDGDDEHRTSRLAAQRRELAAAITAAREDVEDAGERLRAARVAHTALVRRDEHGHRLERAAADEAELDRIRTDERNGRHRLGRATLKALRAAGDDR